MDKVDELLDAEVREKYIKWIELHPTVTVSQESYEVFKGGYLDKLRTPVLSGNQIISYLKEHNETLRKAREDEPIFVLRAQDVSAPRIIMYWIEMNLDIVSEAKIKEAFQTVLAMRRYELRKDPT